MSKIDDMTVGGAVMTDTTMNIHTVSLQHLRDFLNVPISEAGRGKRRMLDVFGDELRRRWPEGTELHVGDKGYTVAHIEDVYSVNVIDQDGNSHIVHPCTFDEWRQTP